MEFLTKKQKIIILGISTLVLLIIVFYIIQKTNIKYEYINEEKQNEENEVNTENTSENKEDTKIIVYITGEIENEGVIELEKGDRIINAIEQAGGMTEEADISNVNLAYELQDGQKIYIPKKGEQCTYIIEENSEDIIEGETNLKKEQVNINTASQTELETISGIGPSTALKIINYRKENGKFNSIEEIKNVSGIGDTKFEGLKNEICVR